MPKGHHLLQQSEEKNPANTESDKIAITYLKDHFAYTSGRPNLELSEQSQQKLETAYLLDNTGRAGIELGKIAFTLKNPELGRALTIAGSAAQGVSSAILFMQTTGALAMGPFAGVVASLATIISVLAADDDSNGMEEAFQAIFQQMIFFRQELHEMRKYIEQFRADLFEYLAIAFDAVFSRFLYQEELMRNGFNRASYEHEQIREGIDAILDQLDAEIVYTARAFHEGKRDYQALTRDKTEELSTKLWRILDQASSNYRSGVTACNAQMKHGSIAASAEIQSILNSPLKRGQVAGYLTCYYQATRWLSQANLTITLKNIINPVQWSEVVKLYLFLRQIPSSEQYDPNFIELHAIEQQGADYVNFVRQHQDNFPLLVNKLVQDIQGSVHTLLESIEYPDAAKKLVQIYPVPQHLKDILYRYSSVGNHAPLRDMPNEFLAFEAMGLGKIIYRSVTSQHN